MAKAGLIKSPFLSGDGKEARNKESGELHPGMGADVVFIRTQSVFEPWVRWKSPNAPAAQQEVYSGCFGKAVINVFAWHNVKSGNGVSFGISGFQKQGEGEKLGGGGGTDPDKFFETIDDDGLVPDSVKDGAGASGLFG
jgi:hypothetical protein